ncbi:winged helix-turn-helix transcriptional regulator [Salinibaculum salinum]|uniref:winged helix-turn-helix transcriptional regulator n=1 Tax=Salinibaculum salinum TaxID=3131996 RepID=UPI0030ED3617
MARLPRAKIPFAPWGDPDAPSACNSADCPADRADDPDCDCDARFKWGYPGHYRDGDTFDKDADAYRKRGDIAGRVFIQRESDPFMFVDGDDVRDPDTNAVHPEFVRILDALGGTYGDVSDSDAGVHAYYIGDLPDEQGQAVFEIDTEPWGSNDDPPTVEIYANKHVCVTTGNHIAGTPDDVRELDDDALEEILDEYDARKETTPVNHDTDRNLDEYDARKDTGPVDHDTDRDLDLDGYDPDATDAEDTIDNIRDLLAAVDRLRPSDLPLRTRQVDTDATGWEKWDPSTYRTSTGGDSLHRPPGEPVFHDHKHGEAFGVLSLFAAEQGVISDPWDRLAGSDWFGAVDAARDAGAPIPEYDSDDTEPVAELPLAKLDALTGTDRERFARKRDLNIPTTDDARDRLRDAVLRELQEGNTTVLDAPTALGKSYTVSNEPWRRHADVTGESPVVHFHPTRDARDDAAETTRSSGATGAVLKGRKERCPVAGGDHDPVEDPDAEDAPEQIVTIDGDAASAWFDRQCDGKGVPFSTAHALARDRNDQALDELPCCEDGDCPAVAQWDGLPRDDDGEPAVDVIHATHQFAYVPSLRRGVNVVLDEQPDFTTGLGQERIRRMVNAYLRVIDAPVKTWEAFVSLARFDPTGGRSDAGAEQDAVDDALGTDPPTEWYVDDPDAHTLAPDLTLAVWRALRWEDVDKNGRRSTKVLHKPPRLDADDGDGYAGTWLSVVIDDENTVRTVRATPDFTQARAVVGLDAHPSMPMWELNAAPGMTRDAVLDPTERRLWRRYERGLSIVQVGDATRPRSGDAAREWMNDERVRTVLDALRAHYGDGFDTAITTAQVEPVVRRLLADTVDDDLADEQTLHYGQERSRNPNAFADADAGYVYGCMDPGDDMILDVLAELGLDAEPATAKTEDGDTVREKGRTFDGLDADTARAALESVRENHVAQAAGRYARAPKDDDRTTVYVHTDAVPTGFADFQVGGVEWLATDTQRAILDALADQPSATTRELADAVGCTKEHVRKTLRRLVDDDRVVRFAGDGDHGADVYREDGVADALLDLGLGKTTNVPLEDTSRWSLAVWNLTRDDCRDQRGESPMTAPDTPVDRGDPPPAPRN